MENTTTSASSPSPAATTSTTTVKRKSPVVLILVILAVLLFLCCIGSLVAAYIFRDRFDFKAWLNTTTVTPASTSTPTPGTTQPGTGTATLTPSPSTTGRCPTANGQAQGTWPTDSDTPAYTTGQVCVAAKTSTSSQDLWTVTVANSNAQELNAYFNSLTSSGWTVMDGGSALGAWFASKDNAEIGATMGKLRGQDVIQFVITKEK